MGVERDHKVGTFPKGDSRNRWVGRGGLKSGNVKAKGKHQRSIRNIKKYKPADALETREKLERNGPKTQKYHYNQPNYHEMRLEADAELSKIETVSVVEPNSPGAPKRKYSHQSKFTPERQAVILDKIRKCNFRSVAAASAGISSNCLRMWLNRGKEEKEGPFFEFRQAFLKAEAEAETGMLHKMIEAADDDWRASLEILRRRWASRWNRDKVVLAGSRNEPITFKVVYDQTIGAPSNGNGEPKELPVTTDSDSDDLSGLSLDDEEAIDSYLDCEYDNETDSYSPVEDSTEDK